MCYIFVLQETTVVADAVDAVDVVDVVMATATDAVVDNLAF